MRHEVALAALMLIGFGCTSKAQAPEVMPRQTSAPAPAPTVLEAAPPAASAPAPPEPEPVPPEKPFAKVAAVGSGAGVTVLGDTIGLMVDYNLGESHPGAVPSFNVDVFELSRSRFVRIGRFGLPHQYPVGLLYEGNTIYLHVVQPMTRTTVSVYEPIRGPGKAREFVHYPPEFYESRRHDAPGCDAQASRGVEPMKSTGHWASTGDTSFRTGESCDGVEVVQVSRNGEAARFFPTARRASLSASPSSVLLVTDSVSRWQTDAFVPFAVPIGQDTERMKVFDAPDGALVLSFRTRASSRGGADTITNFILRGDRWAPLQLPDGEANFSLGQGKQSLWAMTEKATYRYVPSGQALPEAADLSALPEHLQQ